MRGEGASKVKEEAWALAGIAFPIIITNALLMLLQIEDQIILGHLGTDELAAAALGNTVYNVWWFPIAGAASACDTLIAQAYGARDYKATVFWTKMGMLVLTLLCIPAAIFFIFSGYLVEHLFGQDSHLAGMAGRYTISLTPGLFFITWFSVLQKNLQARNILMPSVWVMVLANVLNLAGNWFFIFYLDMGFTGSPIATSCSRILSCLMLTVYFFWLQPKESHHQGEAYDRLQGDEPSEILVDREDGGSPQRHRRGEQEADVGSGGTEGNGHHHHSEGTHTVGSGDEGADSVSFREGFWRFMGLALPGGLMVGLEAWSFDWTMVLAAHFGTKALDAHQSMMSISAFTFLTMPLAVACAASIRVGNLLGAQRPKQAQLAARICITAGTGVMLLFGAVIVLLRHELGQIFSPDPTVVRIVAHLSPILALYQVLDGFQGCAGGVLRGMGRQKTIALLNLGGFWVLGLPFGAALAFWVGMEVYGIWWGFVAGLCVCSLLYMLVLSRINWDEEARRALLSAVTDKKLEHAWEDQLDHLLAGDDGSDHGGDDDGVPRSRLRKHEAEARGLSLDSGLRQQEEV